MLISCSFNSFSVFGHYISARLQIIWRPYLWLVWSFTQMVSFLEFSISNPVFPPLPPFISSYLNATCFIFHRHKQQIHQETSVLFLSTDSLPPSHSWIPVRPLLPSCMPMHPPSLGILTVVYQLLFEPQSLFLFQIVWKKVLGWFVSECEKHILLKRNCGLFTILSVTNLKNYPLPKPTNRDDNSMLYPRLHSLLTICLSPQTWSFHQRQSLSTPVGPYTPQYSYPLRAPALGLVQSSTAQALCCRMTQPPPIL